MQPIIIPQIIVSRWCDAHEAPDIRRWKSIVTMCSDMWINCSVHSPDAPLCDDLRMLADLAYAHMIDMQPRVELEAA